MSVRAPGWWHWLTLPQRALLGACGLLALVSAWLALPLEAGPRSVRHAPEPLEPVPGVEPPVMPSAAPYATLVQRNLFSRSRSAPDERWTPAPDTAGRAPALAPGNVPEPASYRLFGTVVSRRLEDSFAIIEADAEQAGPELYNVGDRVGPYRLTAIYYTRVVLSGDGTRIELRLSPDSLPGAERNPSRRPRPW